MTSSLSKTFVRVASAFAVVLLAGCSSDSPSAPQQTPPPGPGTNPATTWRITLTASPSRVAVGSATASTITIMVRRADNNQPPVNGTTVLVSTNLGDFTERGSGIKNGAVELTGGNAGVLLFSGPESGTATVTAQLETSVGQTTVQFQSFVISSISPNVGRAVGGDTITLTGQGIEGPVDVRIGPSAATVLSFTTEQIVVRTPAVSDPSLVNTPLDVTTTIRAATATQVVDTFEDGFTYRSDFFVERVEPNRLNARGGEIVTIVGTGFEEPLRVVFGDTLNADFSNGTPGEVLSVSPTAIQVRVPSVNLNGQVDAFFDVGVTIRFSLPGQIRQTLRDGVLYAADPADFFIVNSISPTSGSDVGGTLVRIVGGGFLSPMRVEFGSGGGVVAAEVLSVTPTEMLVRTPRFPGVPSGGELQVDVIVTKGAGTASQIQDTLVRAFTYFSDASNVFFVDAIQPSSGPDEGGTLVRITGQGFVAPLRVTFDAAQPIVATIIAATETEIQVLTPTIPALAPGADLPVDVTVTRNYNTAEARSDTLDNGFTYLADEFAVAAITPNTGTDLGGTLVRISGIGFSAPMRVLFGGVAASVVSTTPTELQVRTPAFNGVPVGGELVVDVQVIRHPNATDQSTDVLSQGFTYFSDATNTFFVNSVTPSTGHPNGGETVRINGSGFEPPVRVLFGDQAAQIVGVNTTAITVITPRQTVPAGQTLPVAVSVTINYNEGDQATDVLPNGFIYSYGTVDPPVILSVTPASGPNEGGTTVRINGSGFNQPVQVFFGLGVVDSFLGVEAQVTNVTPNQLVVVSPTATGFGQDMRNRNVDILVRNLNSGLAVVRTGAFRYGTEVIVTSISPSRGIYTGGDLVTINGQGFDEPVTVNMGGEFQQIISVTGTQIIVRTVAIQNPNQCADVQGATIVVNVETGATNSGNDGDQSPVFTYQVPVPDIISLAPDNGPQAGGNNVTITGLEFNNPRVSFGGQTGNVVSSAPTSIVVTVPPFSGSFNTTGCDDNADGVIGARNIPTARAVSVTDLSSGCSSDAVSYLYNPASTTCVGDGLAPDAGFTFTQVNGGTTVQFTDTSLNSPTTWGWDFTNNGTIDSTLQNPTNNYGAFGSYTVRLVVTNSFGADQIIQVIDVAAPPPPVAGFTFQQTTGAPTFTVNYTNTSTGAITGFIWDFTNNGTTDSTVQNPSFNFSGAVPPPPNTYSTRLRATGPGGFDEEILPVTVNP